MKIEIRPHLGGFGIFQGEELLSWKRTHDEAKAAFIPIKDPRTRIANLTGGNGE